MINQDFFLALDALEKEKGITQAEFITALEDSLAIACKKAFGVAYGVTIKLSADKKSIQI